MNTQPGSSAVLTGVLSALGAAFYLILFALIPNEHPEWRTALIGALVLACAAATTKFLGSRVKTVERQTNGNLTAAVARAEAAELRAAQLVLEVRDLIAVSRETESTPIKVKPAKKAPAKKTTR